MGRSTGPKIGRRSGEGERPWGRTARLPRGIHAIPGLSFELQWLVSLEQQLQRLVGQALQIRVTDNVHTMLSFSRRDRRLVVRLHHMFLAAPESIVEALARYIRGGDPLASAALDQYIQNHRRLIRRVPAHIRRKRVPIRSRGSFHDLQDVFDELNQLWFDGKSDCAITWGPSPRVRLPRKSIKLGSYSADAKLIRIHPAMDQREVPRFFVTWIVFHEMLHHRFGISRRGVRRCVHPPVFCEAERAYPDYERARAWEREHLDLLLTWPSSGSRDHEARQGESPYSGRIRPSVESGLGSGFVS